MRFGTTMLGAGRHEVALSVRFGWRPGHGSEGTQTPLGPTVALTPASADVPGALLHVPVSRAEELCDGRKLDWIDVMPRAAVG